MNKYQILLEACEKNDLKKVQELLSKKNIFTSIPDINKMVNGISPLTVSLKCNNDEISKFLIEKGANLNVFIGDVPILHYAVTSGKLEIVKTLIANGADINLEDNRGQTALHKASIEGHIAIVEILLKHNADVYAENNSYSPLYFAVINGHLNIVNLFLEKKVDVDKLKDNPARAAIENELFDLAEIFIQQTSETNKLEDAFIAALEKDNKKLTDLMTAKGVQLKNSVTLESACRNGQYKVVELLLSNGADINNTNALSNASFGGFLEIVKLLISKGANVNGKEISNRLRNPLYSKEEQNFISSHYDSIDRILNPLPITQALLYGQIEVFEYLVENGASLDFPIDAKFQDDIMRMKRLLKEHSDINRIEKIDRILELINSKKEDKLQKKDTLKTEEPAFKFPEVNLEFKCLNCQEGISLKCQDVDPNKGVRCACKYCGKVMNIPPTIYDFGKFWDEANGNALVNNWNDLITLH